MQFLISLLTPAGAVSVRRDTAAEALSVARRIEAEGPVAITTPTGHVLEPSEFAVVWGLA